MKLLGGLCALLAGASLASAASRARNPLKLLGVVENPKIQTPSHRVHAHSTFDISFDLYRQQRIRLHLEPNHDVFAHGLQVNYLGADGEVERSEPIRRHEHRVFKGTAWMHQDDGSWVNVGWARIMVKRDGLHPLFEGAFTIDHNHHNILLRSSYQQTKHVEDPDLEHSGDEYMVLYRDTDIKGDHEHTQLKRGVDPDTSCKSDELVFNTSPEHPVFQSMLKRDAGYWGFMPMGSAVAKRQIDGTPGGGNSAGINLRSTIGSTAGCPTTRKVALVGVATDCTYTATFDSMQTARDNIIQQISTASGLWEQTFNISLGLQNLTISPADCPGAPQASTPWNENCDGNFDIQDRLNTFSTWRGQQQDSNSHWTLLTNCRTGSAVGLAWLGQACTRGSQSNGQDGANEVVAGANVVARTDSEWQVIAHETGHTYGAVHDCTAQSCQNANAVSAQQCCPLSQNTCPAGSQYIMNPSTAAGIRAFSPCSIGNICTALLRNTVKSDCLVNNRDVETITAQQCGNGIVEEGEDCDCGGPEGCGDNQCCDATTCRFTAGSVCDDSNEDCCNQCQLASADTVCRASTGECDPEERCTGTTSICPRDETDPDGQECEGDGSGGLSCASGQCTSRDQQCKTVMGSYTRGNDTYACDRASCSLSCASPEFGPGICYGIQQYFLDGTSCGGGGRCQNGVCRGSSVGGQVSTWIDDNRTLVIGIAAGLGGLLLLVSLSCIITCCRRRTRNKKLQKHASPPPPPPRVGGANNNNMAHMQQQQQQQYQNPNAPWYPPNQQGWPTASPPPVPQRPPPSYATTTTTTTPQRDHSGAWNGPPPPTQGGYGPRYA